RGFRQRFSRDAWRIAPGKQQSGGWIPMLFSYPINFAGLLCRWSFNQVNFLRPRVPAAEEGTCSLVMVVGGFLSRRGPILTGLAKAGLRPRQPIFRDSPRPGKRKNPLHRKEPVGF